MNDIVPALLEEIQKEFSIRTKNNKKLKEALNKLQKQEATYRDAGKFSIEVGQVLSDVLSEYVTSDKLPDGKMYFNIAKRLLNPTMKNNFDLVADYTKDVQSLLNENPNIHLRTQIPEMNQDRIDGIVNRLSDEDEFDKIKWILKEPIINFSQNVVDDFIKVNVEFQSKAGLQPKITRTVNGKACKWCKNLAGTYNYHEEPADFYKRHDRCHCIVEYNPKDGRGVQNSHTKKWRDSSKDDKIEARKVIKVFPKIKKNKLQMNLMLFAEKDIQNQNTASLRRGIKNYEKQIALHKEKIANPEKYISNWPNRHPGYQKGIIKHWEKEIFNFNKSIRDRKDEIARRGD